MYRSRIPGESREITKRNLPPARAEGKEVLDVVVRSKGNTLTKDSGLTMEKLGSKVSCVRANHTESIERTSDFLRSLALIVSLR